MPDLAASTAYLILRPFVAPDGAGGWKVDNTSSIFHGGAVGAGQEITPEDHPHLLRCHFVSIPTVAPGDFVFWHCDVAHMVEEEHQGKEDASVFYIPSLPLCEINASYIRRQRAAFEAGNAPPDFPAGLAESKHVDRGGIESISPQGRAAMGLEAFDASSVTAAGQRTAYDIANTIMAS
jgi:hypothetical protein